MRSLFGFKGVFDFGLDGEIVREKWNAYPNYLKHTVFHSGEDIEKARKMEIGHKFFIVDNLREKGNRRFRKGKIDEAIQFYERGVSVLRWLYCKVDMTSDPFDTSKLYKKYQDKAKAEEDGDKSDVNSHLASDCEGSKLGTKLKLESDAESTVGGPSPAQPQPKKYTGEDEWLNDRFSRLLLTTFHDGNVELFDGQEYTQANEIDMRNSMLFYLFINLACCYMTKAHFSEARIVLAEAEKFSPNNSLYLFRSAQARAYCLDSSPEELRKALSEIATARESKKTEKIFQHPVNLLKMLNVHNLDEALNELELYTNNRLTELDSLRSERMERVLARVAQINVVEQMIIDEGKVPEEGPDLYSLFNDDENLEDTVLRNMLDKYLTVIDFYQETKDDRQVGLAQKEFLQHKKIYEEFAYFWHFNLEEADPQFKALCEKFNVDLSTEKMQKRFKKVLKEKAREIFEAGKFNLELFQYVIDEHFKAKTDKEEKERKEKEEQEREEKEEREANAPSLMQRLFGERAHAKGKALAFFSAFFVLLALGLLTWAYFPLGTLSI